LGEKKGPRSVIAKKKEKGGVVHDSCFEIKKKKRIDVLKKKRGS